MDKARYPLFRDILIENNRFIGTAGATIYLASAGDVTIRGNRFDVTSPSQLSEPTRGGIVIDCASDVSIIGNEWKVPEEASVLPLVFLDPQTVGGVRTSGNRVTRQW